jgi:hypothetical protein
MDIGDQNGGDSEDGFGGVEQRRPRELPDDLPKSLNDRRNVPTFTPETEMYDAWQGRSQFPSNVGANDVKGQSQFLTAPVLAKPLQFHSLSLEEPEYGENVGSQRPVDSDARLMEMLAAQAAHRDGSASEDDDAIATDEKLSDSEKRETLQKALNMAASNGDIDRIGRIIGGKARSFIDLDAPDEEGTAPLIYASCFVSLQASRSQDNH